MSGNKLFIDTNIAIYLLDGDESLAGILHQKKIYISFITQLELLGYSGITKEEEEQIEIFLQNCTIIDINNQIKTEVIRLRRNYSLKLPDSIVAATSLFLDIPLFTSDIDFKRMEELNLMLYEK